MSLRHSGGNAAQDREANLRRRACGIVSTFLNDRPWYAALDFEQGRAASYFFLRPAAEAPCLSGSGSQVPQDELLEPPERPGQVVSTKPVVLDPLFSK